MHSNRRSILCLCHDETALQVRRMLLEHFGYRVWPTRSIEDLAHIAADACPDMLLMDNSFPGIDTERVAQEVKRVCPEMLAVVLSPYFAVRYVAQSAIDRFLPRDEPDVLHASIKELFAEKFNGTAGPLGVM